MILELCGKEFSDRATLQKHSLVHNTTKPHQCVTCFMTFRHKSSLSRHNKIHLKVTQCAHCNRSFRYESFLKKHLLTAHKNSQFLEEFIPKEEVKNDECISVITYDNNHTASQQMIQVEASSHYFAQPMSITISNVEQNYSS